MVRVAFKLWPNAYSLPTKKNWELVRNIKEAKTVRIKTGKHSSFADDAAKVLSSNSLKLAC